MQCNETDSDEWYNDWLSAVLVVDSGTTALSASQHKHSKLQHGTSVEDGPGNLTFHTFERLQTAPLIFLTFVCFINFPAVKRQKSFSMYLCISQKGKYFYSIAVFYFRHGCFCITVTCVGSLLPEYSKTHVRQSKKSVSFRGKAPDPSPSATLSLDPPRVPRRLPGFSANYSLGPGPPNFEG